MTTETSREELPQDEVTSDRVPRDRRDARTDRSRFRVAAGIALTVVSVAAIWVALAVPAGLPQFSPQAFIRLPLVAIAVAAIMTALPYRWARRLAVLAGLATGALLLLKILDIVFIYVLGAPFNPRTDWSEILSGLAVLRDAVGGAKSVLIVSATVVVLLLIFAGLVLAGRRIARATTTRRAIARPLIAALTAIWLIFAVAGVHSGGGPVATIGGARLSQLQNHPLNLGSDPWSTTPANQLLTRLHGHDVLLVFVESYGRVAVQQSSAAPGVAPAVDRDLDIQTKALASAGYYARTGFLTSPTFGGLSWHAHSTLQAGVWVNSQAGYYQLLSSRRTTLSSAFARAGWRSVGVQPANTAAWPQGEAFYHWSALYDNRTLGYVGPAFGFGKVPDEYTLKRFGQLALRQPHKPVMAEIDLVTSHGPWATLPKIVPWSHVNDLSIYPPMTKGSLPADKLWEHPTQGKQAYATSIIYSINSLVDLLHHIDDPNMVVVMLGDHQPAAAVSGQDASHDVPISIISDDPAVMRPIAGWNWTAGLRPDPEAPVWPMSAFRNKFLSAYSPTRH